MARRSPILITAAENNDLDSIDVTADALEVSIFRVSTEEGADIYSIAFRCRIQILGGVALIVNRFNRIPNPKQMKGEVQYVFYRLNIGRQLEGCYRMDQHTKQANTTSIYKLGDGSNLAIFPIQNFVCLASTVRFSCTVQPGLQDEINRRDRTDTFQNCSLCSVAQSATGPWATTLVPTADCSLRA